MKLGFVLKHRNPWVKETRFGDWFQATHIWDQYVVGKAVDELLELLDTESGSSASDPSLSAPTLTPTPAQSLSVRTKTHPLVLDVGSGSGATLKMIEIHLQPSGIVAVDIDPQMVEATRTRARDVACAVDVRLENVEKLSATDETFDIVFCHQTIHHLNDQESAVREFLRVLKPGGLLLLAESCRAFVHSLPVWLLFRHPLGVQKDPEQYLDLLKRAGFVYSMSQVSTPNPFWSQPDFGLLERLGIRKSPGREHTQLNVIAHKPL